MHELRAAVEGDRADQGISQLLNRLHGWPFAALNNWLVCQTFSEGIEEMVGQRQFRRQRHALLETFTQEPAAGVVLTETLSNAVDRVNHQQVASLPGEFLASTQQQLLIGSRECRKTENPLT